MLDNGTTKTLRISKIEQAPVRTPTRRSRSAAVAPGRASRFARSAADADSIGPDCLEGLAPEQILGARFALHPAAAALSSPYPVVTIWEANVTDAVSRFLFEKTNKRPIVIPVILGV